MDQLLIQRTRYLLRARVRRVQTSLDVMFYDSCKQFLHWVSNHPILKYLVHELESQSVKQIDHINKIFIEAPNSLNGYNPGKYSATTISENVSVCYHILKGITIFDNEKEQIKQFILCCLGEYLNGDEMIKIDEAITVIKDVAIDSVYEYLDEQLDERNSIYSILIKYKQRSEWFRRDRLIKIAEIGVENLIGEKALANDVQEYILDQGVEFYVEPCSASGEADLVLKSSEGAYIIVDAKYIKSDATPSSIKKKISDGFHQIYRYCNDFNVSQGFLVNFITSKYRINMGLNYIDGFPYINIGNKNIYYIEINIGNEPSASKSGKASVIEIRKVDVHEETSP